MLRFVVLLLGCVGCANKPGETGQNTTPAPPASDDPSARGPYAVGVTTLQVTDPRGKPLTIEVWYPAEVPEGAEPATYPPTAIAGTAVRNVPPDLRGAPYPLLGFSHGFSGIRFQSVTLMEHVASHGYVLVSPDHTDNTFLDMDLDAVPRVVMERPDDVRYSIDALVNEATGGSPYLGGVVDSADEWSILGHSFGAYTSLVLGGGQLDFSGFEEYCSVHSNLACSFVGELDPAELVNHGQADDRVGLTIPYAPGLWYAFGIDGAGLSSVRRPFLFAGTKDDVLPYDEEAAFTYEYLSAPKKMATFENAGHYPFSDICVLLGDIWAECDPTSGDWADVPTVQAHTNTLTTAYLEVELRGRTELSSYLLPETWDAVDGVTLDVAE